MEMQTEQQKGMQTHTHARTHKYIIARKIKQVQGVHQGCAKSIFKACVREEAAVPA